MRGLRLTVFVVAFLSLTAELMRHSYVRWVEDHTSVLDKYETVDKEIKDATSLAVLETRYAEALEKEKVEKATQSREGAAQYNPESPVFKLRQAIAGWERAENQIRELRYFWVGGLVPLASSCVSLAWARLAFDHSSNRSVCRNDVVDNSILRSDGSGAGRHPTVGQQDCLHSARASAVAHVLVQRRT